MPSSPYNSPSNGIAEQTVKEMKKLVHCLTKSGKIDDEEWTRAFLVYVNTPRRPLNRSPSEIIFGSELRDGIACIPDILRPEHRQAIERRVQAVVDYQLSQQKSDRLVRLEPGQRVAVQDKNSKKWSKFGTIINSPRKRNYNVQMDSGNVVWRNRRFLKPIPGNTDPSQSVTPQPTSTPAPAPQDSPNPDPAPRRTSTRTRRKPQRLGFDV